MSTQKNKKIKIIDVRPGTNAYILNLRLMNGRTCLQNFGVIVPVKNSDDDDKTVI